MRSAARTKRTLASIFRCRCFVFPPSPLRLHPRVFSSSDFIAISRFRVREREITPSRRPLLLGRRKSLPVISLRFHDFVFASAKLLHRKNLQTSAVWQARNIALVIATASPSRANAGPARAIAITENPSFFFFFQIPRHETFYLSSLILPFLKLFFTNNHDRVII